MRYDLLSEPLIETVTREGSVALTLPGVLAAMMRDEVEAFAALRPHQVAAWHMFLAQLGALALERGGRDDPPGTEAEWAALLLALTGGARAPWALVVGDLAQPAFLQPPVPEGQIAALKNVVSTPDALDVLITAKNFDLKSQVATGAGADAWIFALISLQTMEGYLGAGNFGIARMNGGFSARSFLSLAPRGGPGAHLRRDIRAMLAGRERLLSDYPHFQPDGPALLWLLPWDGTRSLPLTGLDPWFIEICRRVRLVEAGDGLVARAVGTSAARLDAKQVNGVTGDFWAPVNRAENKAFSLDARGFSVRVLCQLLFPEGARNYDLPPALTRLPGEAEMVLVARGVTRGQGKTEGFHERRVPMQGSILAAFGNPAARREIGALAERQQKEIAQIGSALRYACAVVARGGSGEGIGKPDYARGDAYVQRLEAAAEAGFFDALQARLERGDAGRVAYLRDLVRAAEALLAEAAEAIPCAAQRRWRARVAASGALHGTLWRKALEGARDLVMEGEAANE